MSDAKLVLATDNPSKAACIAIRKTVFVEEQGYSHLDEDNQPEDADALHFLLTADDDSVPQDKFMGTARLLVRTENTYVISRFALLPQFRGNGNGGKFIQALEQWVIQRNDFQFVKLEAQEGSYGFYEKLGYTSQGAEYIKDKRPHLLMMKDLRTSQYKE
ncbi:acyl-CoA N-acyltransferase [Mycena sp. CBHHK59/15]|nr:acyl-CoA N-acyltransferase [Mycena sp. CBHHK59/15]